jgi:hypothetical protein
MTGSYLQKLLEIRLLVGFLGERAQFDWWPTAFHEPSSRLFLEPVFSKTVRLAQYRGILEAARRLHDEHLSVGSYHLFRLPEEDLHAMVQDSVGEELASKVSQSKDAALESLNRLAGMKVRASVGPATVGNIKDLDSTDNLKQIAGLYFSALSTGRRSYPYLVE